jgi:hypothetical protein
MNQKTMQSFESVCGKAKIYVENDMPIGIFHDFLMMIKGLMVDRMVAAHNEQVKQAEDSMKEGSDLEEPIPLS